MSAPIRILIVVAALVLAAPASAAEGEYIPFVTDFPSTPVTQGAGEPLPAEAGNGGRAWEAAGAFALAAALAGLAALGLTRRRKRVAVVLALVAVGALAAAGIVAAGGERRGSDTVSPKELTAAGWLCVDVPDNWVHCVPPGVDLVQRPPESMLNLNFYTHDPLSADARFLGEETLVRADVWKKLPRQWPCGKGEYGFVPAEVLPPHGYMYCHHFKEPKEPADRIG